MGSMEAARHAGKTQAIPATSIRIKAAAPSVTGSRELPPAHEATTRFKITLKINPRSTPAPSITAVELSTSWTTLPRRAPSAMRMPNYWVRCVTAKETTL